MITTGSFSCNKLVQKWWPENISNIWKIISFKSSFIFKIFFKYFLSWFSILTDGDSVILCYVLYISIDAMAGLDTSAGELFLVFWDVLVVTFISYWGTRAGLKSIYNFWWPQIGLNDTSYIPLYLEKFEKIEGSLWVNEVGFNVEGSGRRLWGRGLLQEAVKIWSYPDLNL